MKEYLNLCKRILYQGEESIDRTGTGTIRKFAERMEFDLAKGFPIITTKKIHFKSIVIELLWFIRGDTNIKFLNDNGISIWNEWADKNGELGPIYGKQWRAFEGKDNKIVDQLSDLIVNLKNDPQSRRHIISAWNVAEISEMTLPPCHLLFQFFVDKHSRLSCQLYQRSADIFLGIPFNISSYSLLTFMIAQVCGLKPGKFIHIIGDAHIYKNHLEQVNIQIKRIPKKLPVLCLNKDIKNIYEFKYKDIFLKDYFHDEVLKGVVSV